jgi:hypothetical protein
MIRMTVGTLDDPGLLDDASYAAHVEAERAK